MQKKIRIIQYGVGPIGASIAKLLHEKESVKICGAIDKDSSKIGRDLGDVIDAPDAPWGVKISANAKEVLEQGANVVMHTTSSSLPKVMEQFTACLEAESCVVSTCEELSYPYRTYPELSAKLDGVAKDWGVAIVGTGVNPGFVVDKLIVTLSAVSQRIEHASAIRIVDASTRRLPLQKKIGAGMSVDEFCAKVKEGIIKHVGLPESVAMVADSLGLAVDKIVETIEPQVASERVRTEYLTIEPGQATASLLNACLRLWASHAIRIEEIILEPGRSISARAGVAIYEIIGTKDLPSKDENVSGRYLHVDGGMADNITYRGVIASLGTSFCET